MSWHDDNWQLLNNWFVSNAILHLEIINWSFTKYENTIIKHIMDMLINQENIFIAAFINYLLVSINAL